MGHEHIESSGAARTYCFRVLHDELQRFVVVFFGAHVSVLGDSKTLNVIFH